MSKAHKHSKLISEWASDPSGYVIWMAYGTGVDFTWVEAPLPCDWNENVQYKLVPLVKKEKRWIICSPKHGDVNETLFDFKPDMNSFGKYCQLIEIEVEV